MKRCLSCRQIKELDYFSPGKARCKECRALQEAQKRALDPEVHRASLRRQYKRNPQKYIEGMRNWAKDHAAKALGCKLRRKYWPHLTSEQALAEWNRIYTAQEGKCSVCIKIKPLVVEHDHDTKIVRSLACSGCNTALGLIKENFDTALNLAKYIQKHKDIA